MKDQIIKFWRDEEGATAIEYGLIAGLIAAGLVLTFTDLGAALKTLFEQIKGALPKTTS